MRLTRLHLRDFRNIEQQSIDFADRFTVLWGENGAGKTNVLESLYFLSTLRSFRARELKTLVRHKTAGARVELHTHDEALGLDRTLSVRLDSTERSTRKTAQLDGKTIRAARDFYGLVQVVLFTPEDLGVLRGSPSGRRQFLDRVLFARDRAHISDVSSYEKVLRSRNRVLKDPDLSPGHVQGLLDTYDLQLSEFGGRIWQRRVALLDEVQAPFQTAFAQIFGPELACGLAYASRIEGQPGPQNVLAALRERRSKDLVRRTTGVGPHLDDLVVTLDGREAGEFASQGQSRALVLAFKIAELRAARAGGNPPILLLDDVSSELDPTRSDQLFATLAELAGQCVLTTTSMDFIRLPATATRETYRVEGGEFRRGT